MKQKIRILHLEDSPRDAALIEDRLAAGGLSCEFTLVGDEAGFELALAAEPFDLILCDYNLPSYDAMAAVALAQDKQSETPLIVISGFGGQIN